MRNRRKAWGLGIFLVSVFSFLVAVIWTSQRFLKVTYETIEVRGLPEKISGLRILHISDLHANNPDKIELNIWEAVAELDFDIVAITGDIVDRNAYQIEPHIPYLEALAKEYPVFFCEGNHDHYRMFKLRNTLEACGVTVLIDEKARFSANGETIEVIGLADWYTADLEKETLLLEDGGDAGFRLMLIHQPQQVDDFSLDDKSCLLLAGHTHGGQWRVPMLPVIYAPGQGFWPKYGEGVYDIGSNGTAKMFVSKGVGSTGKAPFRFWNRPEITVIRLVGKS